MFLLLSLTSLASAVDHDLVSDDAAIYAHLEAVESRLRAVEVSHLAPAQQARRGELLDVLHDYRTVGVFPHNHSFEPHDRPVTFPGLFPDAGTDRTPVFVDEHGTHCAVGYLLAVDGRDALVDRIVDGGNLRYVHEIDDPELLAWAHEAGFTVDELAQIQPSYPGDPVDRDNDGWTVDGGDCDDNDRDVNPDEDEVCDDGVDNNCDGDIDESVCTTRGCSSAASPASWAVLLLGLPLVLGRRRR